MNSNSSKCAENCFLQEDDRIQSAESTLINLALLGCVQGKMSDVFFSYGIRFCLCFITGIICIKILRHFILWNFNSKAICMLITIDKIQKNMINEHRNNDPYSESEVVNNMHLQIHDYSLFWRWKSGENITLQHEVKRRDGLSWWWRWTRYWEILEEEIFGCKDLHTKRAGIGYLSAKAQHEAQQSWIYCKSTALSNVFILIL